MPLRPTILLAILCLSSGTGCAARHGGSVVRFWADWNTLAVPAVYCETLSHRPPSPARVETFRWMYGGGADCVVPVAETIVVAPHEVPHESAWPEKSIAVPAPAVPAAPRLGPQIRSPLPSPPLPKAPPAGSDHEFFDGEGGLFEEFEGLEEFEPPVPAPRDAAPSSDRGPVARAAQRTRAARQ